MLAGATGCGKSTQIPQLLLKAGYRRVLCTQVRRATALATALATSNCLDPSPSPIPKKVALLLPGEP